MVMRLQILQIQSNKYIGTMTSFGEVMSYESTTTKLYSQATHKLNQQESNSPRFWNT